MSKESDTLEDLKIYKSENGATIYGVPEISSAMASFEAQILNLHNSNLDNRGKAFSKHQDRIRMRLVAKIQSMLKEARIEELDMFLDELDKFFEAVESKSYDYPISTTRYRAKRVKELEVTLKESTDD